MGCAERVCPKESYLELEVGTALLDMKAANDVALNGALIAEKSCVKLRSHPAGSFAKDKSLPPDTSIAGLVVYALSCTAQVSTIDVIVLIMFSQLTLVFQTDTDNCFTMAPELAFTFITAKDDRLGVIALIKI